MHKNYANARDVLPEELFARVKEHFSGLLYVPSQGEQFDGRKQIIFNMFEQGTPTVNIAGIMGITRRRVNQIIAEQNNGI